MIETAMRMEPAKAADAANPTLTTTYYVADQIGSSRMDIAYGSWPTWWGAFDPYGAEIDTNPTTNNFKFSGKERDAQTGESGLDNFGARAYSSNLVGRFMQPDPAGLAAANLWNPQSFYLYGYVMNNPLTSVDPTGMESCAASSLQMTTGNEYEGGVGALFAECEVPDPPPPSQAVCTADSKGNLNCTVTVRSDVIDCSTDPVSCLIVGEPRKKKADAPSNLPKPTIFKVTIPGTNYCGPGGNGTPTTRVDGKCAQHDKCEEDANAGFINNVIGTGNQGAIQACNAQLCSGINNIPWPTSVEMGQATLVATYFNCGGYSLR